MILDIFCILRCTGWDAISHFLGIGEKHFGFDIQAYLILVKNVFISHLERLNPADQAHRPKEFALSISASVGILLVEKGTTPDRKSVV